MALANVLDRKPERESVLPYTYDYRSSGRRAFLVPAKLRAVRSRNSTPTPITLKSGARTHSQWRVAQRDVDEGVIGLGEGAAGQAQIRRFFADSRETNIPFELNSIQ